MSHGEDLKQAALEYHRRHPDVVLELRIGNPPALSKALLAHELDAALVTLPIAIRTRFVTLGRSGLAAVRADFASAHDVRESRRVSRSGP